MFFAKKKNKVESDFDLDNELDFDDFDFPDPDVKDDRKPIVKVASGIASGAVEKVKDTSFLKQTLKDALPHSFGESMDIADTVKESVKELYDESAKEIKPAIKEGKKLIGKLVPKESKLVPKAVYELLERWKEEEDAEKRGAVLSKEAQQEAMLSSQLADIFKIQTEMAVDQAAKKEGHERLQEGIALTRHNELSDYARMTAVSVDKLQKYEQSVTLGYQKKSLEIQFRQLFMLQDTLQFAKEDSAKRDNILTAISKNTTLPEAVKIKNTEIAGLTAKNKFSETVYRSLFGGRDNVVETILTNMRKQVIEQVKGAVGAFNMGSDAFGQMQEMKESMNLDGYTEGGKMVGGMGVGWLGSKLGGGIRNRIEEGKLGKPGKWLLDKSKQLTYANENIAQKANTFRTKDHDDGTFFGTLKTLFQNFIPNMRPDLGVDVQTSNGITAQQSYTRRTEKSITEIIPGYLSRILREVQVLRTGNEKIELTQYDLDKNKFTSKSKLDAKLVPKTINQSSANWTNRSLESIMKQIDPTGKELSPEAQKALKKKLLTSSSLNREGNEEFLATARRYGEMDPKLRDEILPVMEKFFAGLDQDKRNEFTSSYNSLASTVASPQYSIQNEINLGNINQLRKLGLVKKDSDQIDIDKVFDYILETKDPRNKTQNNPVKKRTDEYQSLSDRDLFVGPRQPRAPLRKQLKDSAGRLKQRIVDELTPESMEKTGQALRNKFDSLMGSAKEQINNPDSAANTAVNKARDAVNNTRSRARNLGRRAAGTVARTRKNAAEFLQSPDPAQALADKFKGSTGSLSSFFKGLSTPPTQADSADEVQPSTTPLGAMVTPTEQNTLGVIAPAKTKKNKAKARAEAKASRRKNKKQSDPQLTSIANAVQTLMGQGSIPTNTLPEVSTKEETQKEEAPLQSASKKVRGILGDLTNILKNPKSLIQMAKDKATEATQKFSELKGELQDKDGKASQPLSLKDSPVELLKKMGNKTMSGIEQVKSSPKIQGAVSAVTEKAKGALTTLNEATGGNTEDKSLERPMSIKDKPLDLLKKFGKRSRTNLQKLKESDVVTSVTAKATAAMQAIDNAAGGRPLSEEEQAATALSREDTVAQVLAKLKKKGEIRLDKLKEKPGVRELENKVEAIKNRLMQTSKTFSERSTKENVNAVLGQVNTIVDDIKSGKTKDALTAKAKQAKDELVKPNLEKILNRLKASDGVKTDVFVAGEELPRLTALKLQEGHYFDVTTKKVIKEYSDIKGPVIDTTNNNTVVIEGKDLPNLTRIDPLTQAPVKLDLRNFRIPDPKQLATKALQTGLDKVTNAMFHKNELPLDVFIEGIAEPVLTGAGMVRGEYFDKETSEAIRHETQINGAVVNAEGRELVSVEQLPLLRVWVRENKRFEKIKYVGNILARIGRGLWHYQTKIAPKLVMFNLRMLKKAAVATGKFLIGDWKDGVKDVYVKGESKPRLYAARIKAGDYFDFNNGSIINHQDDIKGPVSDRDNKIVIGEEDLDRLQVYDSVLKIFNPFRLAAKAVRLAAKAAKATVKGAVKAAWWTMKQGAALSGKALGVLGKGAVRLFQKAQDVFVMGETKARLSAIRMKEGEYFSKTTGKPILIPDDIDGPVVDKNNEPVLDENHIKQGLVDEAGRPFKSKALQIFGNTLNTLNKVFGFRVKLNATKNGLTSKALMKSPVATAADKSVALLSEIKDMVERFTQPKKTVLGDSDGDGDRENSSEDKRQKREAEKNKKGDKPEAKPGETKEKKNGWLSMLLPAIGGLISKIGGLTSMFGILKTVLGLIPGVGTVARVAGAVAGSSVGKAAIGLAGKGAMGLGRGALGLAARLLPSLGTMAAGTAGAATAGSTIAAAGSGLLAFLSAPVVLGAAATAALGYGGYKLYKYMKNSLTGFEKLRYVQYGFPRGDQQHASKMLELEKYIKGFVREGEKGLTIVESEMDVKNLMSPWGMDPTDEDQMTSFFKWYQERFKPVYLTHLTAIRTATQKTDLSQADKLKGDVLKQFLDSVKFSDGPYHVRSLPLVKPDFKASDASDVRAVVDELIATLAEDKKKQVTGAQLKAPPAPKDAAADKPAQTPLGAFDAATGKPNQTLPAGTTTVASGVDSTMTKTGNRTSALDAVRFKAYGLTEMDASKVSALRMLEREVSKEVTYNAKSAASWKGNPIALLENIAGSFGIGEMYGKESNDWSIWFTQRFLVVYMAYLSAMRTYTGRVEASPNPDTISSEQQLQLAKLLIGLKGIWSVKESPWPNYVLGNSSEATKENINLLDDVAKVTKLQEDRKASDNKESDKGAKAGEQPKEAFKPPKAPDNNLTDRFSSPDAEVKASSSTLGVAPSSAGMSSLGNIAIAGGEMVDGRNAQAYLNFKKDVNLTRVNPQLLKQFYGMVEEYGKMTGKKVGVNDGFRSYEDQVAMKKKYGARAAEPGNSLHEFGLALDVDSAVLGEMEKMGLMRKYGFTRPVGGEPWHMEPAGIQTDISGYKRNASEASHAIKEGVGRGGGGLGTVAGAPLYARNRELAMKLLAAAPGKAIENKPDSETLTAQAGDKPAQEKSVLSSMASTVSGWFGAGNKPAPVAATPAAGAAPLSADQEAKPQPGIFDRVKSAFGFGSNVSTPVANLPADPSVKVPDAKGSGFGAVKDTIAAAAKMVGVDPSILFKTAAVESGFNPSAKAGTSSASGLFQFTKGTWEEMVTKYGAKYGYTPGNVSPFDPKAAAIMGAHYIKDSMSALGKRIGRAVGATETYMAHFLGPAGAGKFLTAMEKNPQAPAAQVMPEAAASNKPIFYEGGRPRTMTEVYSVLDKKVATQARAHGVPAELSALAGKAAMPSESYSTPHVPGGGGNKVPGFTPVSYSPGAPAPANPVSTALTNQSNSPLADAYGFKPMQQAASLAPQGQTNQLSKELFTTTENLLGQSVEIQKKMLEVMSNIFGVMSSNKPAPLGEMPKVPDPKNTNANRYTENYTVPKVPVSMARSRLST
ncbi:MAG: transglycosylase SLT domain-containing protein [Rhodoferax sp.]|uniref:transglycosylase SLT domain-containing protein n=1 Tax=Rhodoferax sp. TaxID=50421 RepID=UPI00261FEE08|nr:transglycosylase SLT domain-containing protein [Rhodoferax sp.]MDD2879796.1 transglycosylase SLT domain-containing protein [Rhodoferax sp.]